MKIQAVWALALALAFGSVTFANQAAEQKNSENVVTGCLTMGSASGEFVITEEGTGKRWTVVAGTGMDLAKHDKHKVKLTVTPDPQKPDRMTVTKAEHVANTCSAS
ncbi:MAG: hypothetical protein SFV18_10240 [Bryobacteraceae bacterium]|nr:hypothetical protein [Bryobacteraceae bacterium]